ncbi:PEP/pyruvate-binding domain-containing protein [Bacillus subtilis]|nr:PEP/pyruvate-binding domain-containing protein [Bacillus subtilis]
MLITLSEATRADTGGKAATLGLLLHEGLPVPDGFVVTFDCQPAVASDERSVRAVVADELARLGDPMVAVRSSASNEDTAEASAAGQYESFIGVQGADEVCRAIFACRESAGALRVADYLTRTGGTDSRSAPRMAVLVQPMIEAEISGVMFTPQDYGEPTRIEASWGLGLSVVGGIIAPDTYEVASDRIIGFSVGSKQKRIDLDHEHGGVVTSAVTRDRRSARTLDDATVAVLTDLGSRIASVLDGPQDIEWAVAGGAVWILQARPITAALPSGRLCGSSSSAGALNGTPGSHGVVTAAARIVRGPSDFPTVRAGEIVVCPYTDPAWTPLFTVAAGVVTETGGTLSHAAIVAREYCIPAVLGIDGATAHIEDGVRIRLDGTAGTVTVV